MSWLKLWDHVLQEAVESGQPGELWKYDRKSASFYLVARTRHPAFMGAVPAKVDPERDNG
jgi:hypothetical protein